MISERPLFGKVELEVFIDDEWVPLLADATGLSIQRGAVREGVAAKLDVGILTFTLLDAHDPMDGGALLPNMPVRVISGHYEPAYTIHHTGAGVVYTQPFSAFGTGDWYPADDGSATWTGDDLNVYEDIDTEGTSVVIERTFTGLVVGAIYTFAGIAKSYDHYTTNKVRARKGGGSWGTYSAVFDHTAPVPFSVTFTASSTTHSIEIEAKNVYKSSGTGYAPDVRFDDFTLTEDDWDEEVPEVIGTREPIFTGKIASLTASYELDKQRGTTRSYTTVSAVDAVKSHTTVKVAGIDLSGVGGYETFESRIDRLDNFAIAPIDAPAIGGPSEVYSL